MQGSYFSYVLTHHRQVCTTRFSHPHKIQEPVLLTQDYCMCKTNALARTHTFSYTFEYTAAHTQTHTHIHTHKYTRAHTQHAYTAHTTRKKAQRHIHTQHTHAHTHTQHTQLQPHERGASGRVTVAVKVPGRKEREGVDLE
jgi:hypothetical protein